MSKVQFVQPTSKPDDTSDARSRTPRRRSPLKFFVLVLALSIPFWLVGNVIDVQLMPGLPISALGAFCPLLAALILVHTETGTVGVVALLRRSFDYRRIRVLAWYAPVFGLMPIVSVVVYGLMRWMGVPLPVPQFRATAAVLMFLAFFVGALGEELGWSGYAIDPMQDRLSALQASILLGLVLALWHVVPLVQAHRAPAWIVWWCLYSVAARVLIVWLYNNTGKSVFAAAAFHAMLNLSWMLFPVDGSHFDVRLAGLVMALAAVIVTMVWGPKTLTHHNPA